MNTIRSSALLTAVIVLIISACSSPDDLTASTLQLQFGTDYDDRGIDVAITSNGSATVLSEEFGFEYDDEYRIETAFKMLRAKRYAGDGTLIYSSSLEKRSCADADSIGNPCSHTLLKPRSLAVDSQGHTYALFSIMVYSEYYGTYFTDYQVAEIEPSGRRINGVYVGNTGGDSVGGVVSAAVDGSGNIYAAGVNGKVNPSTRSFTYTNFISKHSTLHLELEWQRSSPVGKPADITVSSTGNLYVVGSTGISRISSGGNLVWAKQGNFEEVIVSGSNIYTRYRKEIRKYDGNGKQLWLKTQGGLDTMVFQDMDGDGNGNVYLSGKYDADLSDGRNMNAMVRKLSPSGSVLWTKTYGTPAYDDALGISTTSGSNIFVTGETQGSLAHPNLGGPEHRDGYLRKLNSSGNPLWIR